MVALPQAIAFAMLSGVPPAHGLAAATVAAVVGGLVSRSRQVASGPTNTTSLLILGAMAPFLSDNGLIGPSGLPALATLAFLAGAIRVILALTGGAALVRFLPESVLVGFTAGAATLIAGMQVDEALGLPAVRALTLRAQIEGLWHHSSLRHYPSPIGVLFAGAVLFFVLAGRKRFPKFPVALVAVLGSTVLAWAAGLSESAGLPLVADRTGVPSGWPHVALPVWDLGLVERLLTPAFAMVLLGTLELAVSAKAGGERPNMRREVLAQGWANVAVSFTGGLPSSASFTRSALLRLFGARTRVATITAGIFTLPAVLFGSKLLEHIPLPVLAGVLMAAAWSMLDRTAIRRLFTASHETRLLLILTFVATLVLPLEWAVLLGSGAGIVIHLANTSAPRLTLLAPDAGRLKQVEAGQRPAVVVLEVSGNLHYAAVPPFVDEAEKLIPDGVARVVLDVSHAHEIRFTALRAFERLDEELAHDGAKLVLAGVEDDVVDLIRRSGSPLAFVPAEAEPGAAVRKALEA